MLLCFLFIIFSIDKNLEPQTIVLITSHTEPIVNEQMSIIANAVGIEQLVTLPIAGSVSTVHRKVDIVVFDHLLVFEPFFEVFTVLDWFIVYCDPLP